MIRRFVLLWITWGCVYKETGMLWVPAGEPYGLGWKKDIREHLISVQHTVLEYMWECCPLSDLLGHPMSIRESQLECLHCLWHRVISLCPDMDKNMCWNFLQSTFALMILKARTPLNLLNKHHKKMQVPMKSPQFTCTWAVNKQGPDTSFEC